MPEKNDPVFSNPEVSETVVLDLDCSPSETWRWLRTPPLHTIVRVNTLKTSRDSAILAIQKHIQDNNMANSVTPHPALEEETHIQDNSMNNSVTPHPALEEVVVIDGRGRLDVVPREDEVVVGAMCGLAVLRGADVFAPGVMGAPAGMEAGDEVAVVADVEGECLKGRTKAFDGVKEFVGNGKVMMSRSDLFKGGGDAPGGVAVKVTERVFDCPSLDERMFGGEVMLQNLPSIVAVRELDPRPGERILDMCAAPGGKTTHIATRMGNTGEVVAFDKSKNKVKQIEENASRQGLTNIRAFVQDGTKSVDESDGPDKSDDCPPFRRQYFDRILLDAPCSALGQRPQFRNKMKPKELNSFPKIQKRLFRAAVALLQKGGVLVYSTCTFTKAENEDIVSWALDTFPEMEMGAGGEWRGEKGDGRPGHISFGHPRKDLTCDEDTIGFFICKFRKRL